MKKLIFALLLLSTQLFAQDSANISKIIRGEWNHFRNMVETLEPDGDVGGYMNFKEYGDMTLLWRISNDPNDHQVIRFFMDRPGIESFSVTYHKSDIIVDGRMVLRRFVGTEPTGWINHTIDYNSNEYLGRQGFYMTPKESELQMMKDWDITVLEE